MTRSHASSRPSVCLPFQFSLSHWGPFSFLSIFQCCYCGVSFATPKITLNIQEMAGTFSKRLWIKCYLPLRRGRRFIHINLLQLRVRVAVLFNWFLDTRMKLANLTFFSPTHCGQLNASQEVVRTIWSQTCHERQRNRERGTLYPLDCFLLGTPTLSTTSLSVAFLNSIARMLIWLRLLRKHWIDKRTQPGLAEKTPTMRLFACNGTFFPLKN